MSKINTTSPWMSKINLARRILLKVLFLDFFMVNLDTLSLKEFL
jgi:hypothetical protein